MAEIMRIMQGVDWSQQAVSRSRAEISYRLFIITIWSFTAVTICTVLTRLAIRLKITKKLSWDDALVVLSWLMLLATAVLWQIYMHYAYDHYEVVQGKRPFDATAIHNFDQFLRLIVPTTILFYTGLWAIKFSFLLFFKKLGGTIRSFGLWWWFVLLVTAASYIVCIGDLQYECTTSAKPIEYVLRNCATFSKISFVMDTFYANCALDVGTDLLILSIPITVLWNTRVPLRKKLVLFAVFAATIAIMTVAIIRVTLVSSHKQSPDIPWKYFWYFVENGTAIIIACVGSFRQLFVSTHSEEKLADPTRTLPSFVNFAPSLHPQRNATNLEDLEGGQSEEQILQLEFRMPEKPNVSAGYYM